MIHFLHTDAKDFAASWTLREVEAVFSSVTQYNSFQHVCSRTYVLGCTNCCKLVLNATRIELTAILWQTKYDVELVAKLIQKCCKTCKLGLLTRGQHVIIVKTMLKLC